MTHSIVHPETGEVLARFPNRRDAEWGRGTTLRGYPIVADEIGVLNDKVQEYAARLRNAGWHCVVFSDRRQVILGCRDLATEDSTKLRKFYFHLDEEPDFEKTVQAALDSYYRTAIMRLLTTRHGMEEGEAMVQPAYDLLVEYGFL